MQHDETVNGDTCDSSSVVEATEEDTSDTTTIQAATFVPPIGDHDYSVPPTSQTEKLEGAQKRIEELEAMLEACQKQLFSLQRFSCSDADILFYTGFVSYSLFINFYRAFAPSAVNMIKWSQMQRLRNQSTQVLHEPFYECSLPLIDQFFMFLKKIRLGTFDVELSHEFNVSSSTVSRTIITWTNYLYFLLGSQSIWPDKKQVLHDMPAVFRDGTYRSVRVIIDCTEIRVQKLRTFIVMYI